MPLIIVRDDLTHMQVDAVVNTANVKLLPGSGGVSGAIHKAAGEADLISACEKIGGCVLGGAVMTPGFKLPARHIFHTPGMVWIDGSHGEESVLRSCYASCLKLAAENGFESVAFPLIGSGAHGYPKDLAMNVATQEIGAFLMEYEGEMTVYLAVFGHRAFGLAKKLHHVTSYIDDAYVDARPDRRRQLSETDRMIPQAPAPMMSAMTALPESALKAEPSFAEAMLKYIDAHHMTDPEVYKRANITKQNYYKIKTEKSTPKKTTALALCVAMRLNVPQTERFLALAGYALSPASRPDLIVRYFISRGVYDYLEINGVLFDEGYDKYQLGSAEK